MSTVGRWWAGVAAAASAIALFSGASPAAHAAVPDPLPAGTRFTSPAMAR
jgi:hypothetical protein